MSSGFQRTVIGLYSFGSSCRAARHGCLRAEGPSGPSGGPSIRGVENRQEILGNDHGNHVRKVRERPGTGSSAQASERRCEWEGATPFALIPRRGRTPLPLNPRIRAPHTIDIPRPDIKRNILGMPASPRVHVTPRTHRSGCGQNDHPGALARESCLPFSDKLGTPWLFENGGRSPTRLDRSSSNGPSSFVGSSSSSGCLAKSEQQETEATSRQLNTSRNPIMRLPS
jgi:hypothetical protein